MPQKPFAHNLDRLVDESNRQGLAKFVQLTPADESIIRIASAWYDTPGGKRLQYFGLVDAMTGFKGAPDYAALEKLAARMQSKNCAKRCCRRDCRHVTLAA